MKIDQIRQTIARQPKVFTMIGVALLVGSITGVAMHRYLKAQAQALEARFSGKSIAVVAARSDLPFGTRLTTENLAARTIPAEFTPSNAVTAEDFERLLGRAVAVPMKKGDPVTYSILEGNKVPTFSARVERGRRAMTVPVDEINSISGMLEPEDLVDLIVTQAREGHHLTFPLLQKVRVLATGQRSVNDPKTGEKRQFSTVTLDTSPEQAQRIIAARDQGKLTALLRNPLDGEELQAGPEPMARPFVGGIKAHTRRPVPILYGDVATGLRGGEASALRGDTVGAGQTNNH